jgi:undecaprenyl-diphosphatase
MLDYIDDSVFHLINGFARESWSFDLLLDLISSNRFFKGGVIVTIYWFLWFPKQLEANIPERRKTILASLTGTLVALFIAMVLAVVLPLRIRPIHDASLNMVIPFGVEKMYDGWNSFPSDTATYISGLATGILLISRPIGLIATLYAVIVVMIPRVYTGFHYPSDMVGGILIGASIVMVTNIKRIKNPFTDRLLYVSERYPQIFYSLFFLFTFELASMFNNIRHIGNVGWVIIKGISKKYM